MAGAKSTCRLAPGSRFSAASARCCWPGCRSGPDEKSESARRLRTGWWKSSVCQWQAGADRVVTTGLSTRVRFTGAGRCRLEMGRAVAGNRAAMLEEVRITSLGVIDEAVLDLSGGFNVVTGETGAGKTMVVSGLGLLFGGRADPSRVRPGAERAVVEGRLRVEPGSAVARQVNDSGGDLDDDGSTLILVRSVSSEGRSRATAGGRSVPVSLLTYLADDLVAVHGQADQQQLLRPGRQRQALDQFAGPEFAELLSAYQRVHQRHAQVRTELDELTTTARERTREAEDLRHGVSEIERSEPVEGEDIELVAEEERLANADALHAAATVAHEALVGDPATGSYDTVDVTALLAAARSSLDSAAQHDSRLGALAARIGEAAYLLADVAAELASYVQSVEADPVRLAAVQDRRADLTRLVRAYGAGRA